MYNIWEYCRIFSNIELSMCKKCYHFLVICYTYITSDYTDSKPYIIDTLFYTLTFLFNVVSFNEKCSGLF